MRETPCFISGSEVFEFFYKQNHYLCPVSNNQQYHILPADVAGYVNVVLPIAIPNTFTYFVPMEMMETVQFGMRVEVEFGKKKRYAAMVVELHDQAPENYDPKPLLSIIDELPIISPQQYQLWEWMADYYACSIGEIMNAALPGNLRLSSETIVTLSPIYDPGYQGLSDSEFIVCEALANQKELTVDAIRKILDRKKKSSVYPVVNKLLKKKLIYLKEELQEKYKPKKVSCVRLASPYATNQELLEEAFDLVSKAERQMETLMAFLQLSREYKFVKRADLIKKAGVTHSVIQAMVKKKIFEIYDNAISRISAYTDDTVDKSPLSEQQKRALSEIDQSFEKNNVTLLHGVTGSGKTRVYIEKIQAVIEAGGQVLYLIPEIALTVQITSRLQKIFGDKIGIFHSRLNGNERVEMWHIVKSGKPIIMGVRSSLFLPFQNLQLIIVDEEHDTSFKQYDPAPRYNARDTAVYLAHLHRAKVLLGTATPSIETYYNARNQKYGLVEMTERFGGIQMPEMILVDALAEHKAKKMTSHFTSVLLAEMQQALKRKEQIILFQNRRGYAPSVYCQNCAWTQECKNCDVTLTFHKFTNTLRCHYCSFQVKMPPHCPACGEHQLAFRGFGTEKIEDELKQLLPEARIARMDFDTIKGKHAHAKIIHEFEDRQIDILIGTQMVTKGLDFENVSIVGVLSVDHLLRFPDFRATERAFQMITQVSGRAGRKHKRGKVILQAFDTKHPVIPEILANNYLGFYQRELDERQAFHYPPFKRLIQITIKHKIAGTVNDATRLYTHLIKERLGERVVGPAVPGVPRVRNQYLLLLMVKLEKNAKVIRAAKDILAYAARVTKAEKGFSGVRINIDVDPM